MDQPVATVPPRRLRRPRGAVLCAAGALAALLAAAELHATAAQFGVCINARDDVQSPTQAQLAALGARWVRTAVYKDLQPRIQTIANRYSGQAQVLVILNHETYGVNPPAPTASDATWTTYATNFAAAMRNFASLYDSFVGAYEIWNEANITFDMPPARFAQIVKATRTELRKVSSKPIIVGGLAANNANWRTYLQTTIANLASADYDGVGWHPYQWRADHYPATAQYGAGEMEAGINDVYAIGGSKPVWITEFGIPREDLGGSEPLKAEYLRRAYALFDQLGTGKVRAAFWFAWDDRVIGPDGTPRYGLVDANHLPRPAWNSFRRVLCSAYTTSSECGAGYATQACDPYTCNGSFRGCFPVGTAFNDACGGLCGSFQTVGQCNLAANSGACAWYLCAHLCLPRGTPVPPTCTCSGFAGIPACNQNTPTCAYYSCREKCLATGTPVNSTCNFF